MRRLTFGTLARCYVGPDQATAARRAEICASALAGRLGPVRAAHVGRWVDLAWESLLDELVEVLTRDLHD